MDNFMLGFLVGAIVIFLVGLKAISDAGRKR